MKFPKSLLELIPIIRENPVMYLGKKDIHCLGAYLYGFCSHPIQRADLNLLNEFQTWIQQKYAIEISQNWASILLFFSIDTLHAVDLFFEEFEKFVENKI